jgi:hypothetical protein
MKGRSQGASKSKGGAALFVRGLFDTISRTPTDKYKIHLVAHSAGSIYLGWLYQNVLSGLFQSASNVALASIQFMAPAITAKRAKEAFFAGGNDAVSKDRFRVYMLKTADEDEDSIYIYPTSLLTYVADHLESAQKREPLLGIRKDFVDQSITFATPVQATVSTKHGEFDDPGHEIETILTEIAAGKF